MDAIRDSLKRVMTMFLSLLAAGFVLATVPAAASVYLMGSLESVAQITLDDDGRPLSYPSSVFYDPVMEEIYLVNGGSGRVVVYGPDFFPRVSIGIGRGVAAPQGGAVMSNGEVYICQARTRKNPSARITILNGAFFVDREILLEEIPEAANFSPRQLAVNREGVIYLAGSGYRGVLVLDKEGNYLRRIQPTDVVRNLQGAEEAQNEQVDEPAPEESFWADIPEEFRPRNSSRRSPEHSMEGVGPVRISYVTVDAAGNLYMISDETSRIYVYGPDESFLFAFGEKGGSPGQQSTPKSLAIDEERKLIYVVDYMRHCILVYNMAGEYLFEFGGRGFGPGWFNFPSGIAINNHGQIIVVDIFNKRVQVLEVEYIEVYGDKVASESTREEPDEVEEPPDGDDYVPSAVEAEKAVPNEESNDEPPAVPALRENSLGEDLAIPSAAEPGDGSLEMPLDINPIENWLEEEPTGLPASESVRRRGPIVEEILTEEAPGMPADVKD